MTITELEVYASGLSNFEVLGEENFLGEMAMKAEPYLEKLRQHLFLSRENGQKLYAEWYKLPSEEGKGTIFVSHGFTEFAEKYNEVFYYMLQQGYHVCAMEHRGHGNSGRPDTRETGTTAAYVEQFQDYVDDLHAVVQEVMQKKLPGPYYIYGHSMGGCIAALYLEQHPEVFEKAILNAPMLEVNRGGLPKIAVKLITGAAEMSRKKRELLFGQTIFSEKENFEGSAGTCYNRYLYYFKKQLANSRYRMAGASFHWAREAVNAGDQAITKENCKKVKVPVLLFQAQNDSFVSPGGQQTFITNISDGTLVKVPGSKHEIYLSGNEILKRYWAVVFRFFQE